MVGGMLNSVGADGRKKPTGLFVSDTHQCRGWRYRGIIMGHRSAWDPIRPLWFGFSTFIRSSRTRSRSRSRTRSQASRTPKAQTRTQSTRTSSTKASRRTRARTRPDRPCSPWSTPPHQQQQRPDPPSGRPRERRAAMSAAAPVSSCPSPESPQQGSDIFHLHLLLHPGSDSGSATSPRPPRARARSAHQHRTRRGPVNCVHSQSRGPSRGEGGDDGHGGGGGGRAARLWGKVRACPVMAAGASSTQSAR